MEGWTSRQILEQYVKQEGSPSDVAVSLYVREQRTGKLYQGAAISPQKGSWHRLSWQIPSLEGAVFDEMGFCFYGCNSDALLALVDDLYADGNPDYTIDFSREKEEVWNPLHREVSQFTRLGGCCIWIRGSYSFPARILGRPTQAVMTGRIMAHNFGLRP